MSECKMCGKLNPTTDCYSCLIEHFENHVEDLKKERDELKRRVDELTAVIKDVIHEIIDGKPSCYDVCKAIKYNPKYYDWNKEEYDGHWFDENEEEWEFEQ